MKTTTEEVRFIVQRFTGWTDGGEEIWINVGPDFYGKEGEAAALAWRERLSPAIGSGSGRIRVIWRTITVTDVEIH